MTAIRANKRTGSAVQGDILTSEAEAMNRLPCCSLLAAAVLGGTAVSQSAVDRIGVYGLVDRVTFHPDEKGALWIQVFGAFALAGGETGSYYRSPRWGYVAFRLPEEAKNREVCRKQWDKLEAMAGTGKVVGLGSRAAMEGVIVHDPDDVEIIPAPPFHTGTGVREVHKVDHSAVQQLRHLPRPRSPLVKHEVECEQTGEQRVQFVASNCLASGDDVRYLFEVEQANGDIRASPPIAPGPKQTSWTTTLALKPGRKVTWRVRVVRKGLAVAPVATATFVPK